MYRYLAHISLFSCLALVSFCQAAIPHEVRTILESTHQLTTLSGRDSVTVSNKTTTVSHIDKQNSGNKKDISAKYTRLPPNTYCKNRSAVVAGDQDLYNKPSTNTHPLPGQPVGYILCSGIKKPNTSKYLSIYLVQPKHKDHSKLKIHTLKTHVYPDNYDAANDKSFSYHYNMTLPTDLKGNWTFCLLETYDVFEPPINNLVLTQSFPLNVG